MAELYAKPYEVIDTGYNPQQTQQGGQDAEMQSYLQSLPPEERQKAIERINAPLSGEELAVMAQSGQKAPTLEEYAEIEKYHKNQEVSFIDGLGRIAEGGEQVMTDLSNAFASFLSDPKDATSKMPATAVEAFAQGTRNFYGMLAQSGNPDSTLFRVKDFLNGSGTIEDRYNQYMEALKFTKESSELAEGKRTLVMDKDMINHEVTQAMAYIADPTLFIPFGKVASTGLRAVGLGEKLAMAGARSAAIKNGILGNTIKWGAGQPLEFMGGAVRNTIDYGLEKAGAAFEATTGISGKEFAQTARMSGVGFSASGIAGHAIPYASTISDAYLVGSSARGFGEALTLVGETMKNNQFGRGVRSWAAESLKQAEKNGVALSPHAKGLLKTLDAVDPLFAYGWNGLETAAEGAMIGGGLGYLSGGEEGMYSGIGAGIALGAVGGTAGKVVADVTGGTNIARRAVQAKMTIEGQKVINAEKAMFFQAMQKAAEVRGKDVDLVNSIIIGIDEVAPNFEFHALTPEQFVIEAAKKGYNPETGKFMEMSAIDSEFGGDRASKSKAMYVLRSVGGDFVGNRQGFLDALKKASAKDTANPNKPASNIPIALRKYTDVAKTFERLSKTQQEAILKEIDGQGAISKELGGNTKLREHYDALTWSEAWTDSLVKKFESDREGARKDITEMLAQETDKKGKLTRKGRALTDKLRAEGFLDKEGKLLRERNLLQADLTFSQFEQNKGAVIGREADGKTHMYINLTRMGDETFPHELFHTIMRESPMKKHFTDSLVTKLLGTVDKDGNLVRPAEVNVGQVTKFFKKYIDLTHRNEDGTLDAQASEAKFREVQDALTEYQNAGANKKISDKARGLLENYSEEFGAYYFSHWLMGRNRNTLFFGGELKGIEGIVERTKDSFMDFWQSKISKSNPEFDFSKGLNASFDRSKGLGRIGAIDYYMRDMVRAASNANREAFRPDAMTLDNLKDFERSNGIRNLTSVDSNRRLNPREQVTQNIRLGKEAYKILSGLDKNLRTSKDVVDENGKQVITGRLSENELDALVKGGIVPRAWADKVNQGYAMLDGTVSNIFSAGYLGKTEQTTDASYPRLTGKDVAFKNRKAVLTGVETKIKADGTFYTLFHTLDLAVIEQEANRLWQNTDYRNLWNGDRASMEADFFRYISNASKASTDTKKLDSAALLERGDGLGGQRRDVLHQMGRMALQTGDAYKHQPIAVIPEGIRHSVTTFNIDGMTMPRVDTGARYDIDMKNAHKFIRENWQPDEMKQEKTPSGVIMTHETGFKFTRDNNGKVSAYANDGSKVGTFGSIKEATNASKNLYNKAQDNIRKIAQVAKQKEVENRKNLQPLDEAFYEEAFRIGDMFKTKRMQEIVGNSRLVRQTFDEFLGQKVEEITSGKNEQEKVAILQRLFSSEFKELIDLEAELKKEYEPLQLESRQLQEQEKEIIGRLAEFSQEKKRLQQFSDPDARIDVGILEMFERNYRRKEEVNKRVSEIVKKEHDAGITDYSSHYYMTKRFLQMFKETGKLSEEAIAFAIKPSLIKAFEANFETGKAVTFLANHGTPNHELIVSKTFNTEFLGRNTGSLSAFNATFFAGSKETSLAFVGVPLAKTWVRDFIQARPHYVKEFSPELVAKLESMLSSDTSKGVVQKVKYLINNAHIEFPDDFKLKDTHRKTKEGEPIIASRPESTLGYKIDTLLDRMLENANDEGAVFGGVETYWEEAGRKPYLLRNIVKMDNPLVHEYAKADYRDETFASVIQRAKDAGHDGVIFKNTKDGGGLDTIFASFAKNEDNKIFTLETTEDTRFVPRGNDEAGNKIKNGSEIEGRNYQPTEGDDYRGTHKAPSGENGEGSLDAMDRTYPEDLYSAQGARYYGSGDNTDKRMHELIMKFRGKPDAMVTVYRAVPKGVDASIIKGDWVTPLREYAVLHGNRWEQGMTILEKKVKASELFTEGNSLYEFGWSPKELTEADSLRKEIADQEKWIERSRNKAPIMWETKGSKIYGQREAMERKLSSLKYELKQAEKIDKPKFEPAEAEKAPVNWVKEGFNTEGYNAEIIWMKPSRFLNLATKMGGIGEGTKSREKINAIKQALQRQGGDMDMPYFAMRRTKSGELKVGGHEGRHRAVAIQELYGDKLIPVYLQMSEEMKQLNAGNYDWGVPVSERKKGTVSKEFKALEETPFLNEEGTARYQPDETTLPRRYDLDQAIIDKIKPTFKFPYKEFTAKEMLQFIIDNNGHMSPIAKELISSLDEHGLSARIGQQTSTKGSRQIGTPNWSWHNYNPSRNRVHMLLERKVEDKRKYTQMSYEELMIEEILHAVTSEKVPEPIKHGSTIEDTLKTVNNFLNKKELYKEQYRDEWKEVAGAKEEWFTIADAYKKVHQQIASGKYLDGTPFTKQERHSLDYRLSNMSEFVIGITQTKALQRILSDIKVPKSETTLLTKILDAIRSIWNFDDNVMGSLLEHTSDAVEKVIKRDKSQMERYGAGRYPQRAKEYFGGMPDFKPTEGVNASVNEANRNFILDTITANDNSRRALEEGMKQAKDRKQNFITIDNINPDLLRGEAVVMHSPDNAGVEPVQIGRFTVNPRGGARYPSENPTLGWAGVKAGLGKQINENGEYNFNKGKGWNSGVGLIKGEYSKMKGTHIGLEVFLRNLQKYTDNNVLTERQTIQILKNGLGDIGDTKRPLDTIVEGILAKSAKHEAPYTIDGRRTAIEKMTETDGSASLWKYLQSDLTKLEPQVEGFSSEGVTNAKQFIKALLEPMYEAVSDPLTRHAKVGEVYGYLMFRSPVIEPPSDVHPSYKYAVQPEKGGSPVQLDILSTPMSARKAFTNRITAGVVSPLPESEAGFKVSTGQKHIPTMRGTFMPAEYAEFKSEQSATGRILRNAKGYVIMLANNKFRVYNPAKAIIGVYGNEEEAKKRIYKEIPKR